MYYCGFLCLEFSNTSHLDNKKKASFPYEPTSKCMHSKSIYFLKVQPITVLPKIMLGTIFYWRLAWSLISFLVNLLCKFDISNFSKGRVTYNLKLSYGSSTF